MAFVRLSLLYAGSKSGKLLTTFFDDSISLSRINAACLNDIESPTRLTRPRTVELGSTGYCRVIDYKVCLDFYINNILLSDEFLIVPDLNEEVVMGGATIRKWRIKLNFEDNSIYVDPKVARHQLI
jgi:hypothetical protein